MLCRLGPNLNDKHTWPSQIMWISNVTGLNFPTWPSLFVFACLITSDFWSPHPRTAVSDILIISARSETQFHWQLSLLERNRQRSQAPQKLSRNNISLCASACWADISIRGSMGAGLHWVGWMEDREIKRKGGEMTSGGKDIERAERADVEQKMRWRDKRVKRGHEMEAGMKLSLHTDRRQRLVPSVPSWMTVFARDVGLQKKTGKWLIILWQLAHNTGDPLISSEGGGRFSLQWLKIYCNTTNSVWRIWKRPALAITVIQTRVLYLIDWCASTAQWRVCLLTRFSVIVCQTQPL